uniref:Tail protein n=1 Tax=viral metagenome TaxID=1070528 RepID=A0A6M3XK52_9ZZZZ
MTISGSTIVHDSVLKIRALIASGVTDPISASRSSDTKFVMTSFPDRKVEYPVITIEGNKVSDERLGTSTQAMKSDIHCVTNIWSKSTKQRDALSDSVYQTLKTSQMGTQAGWTGTELDGLYDFKFFGENNIDEEGQKGIHRKRIEFGYFVIG